MGVLNITPDSFSDGGRWYGDGRPDLDAIRREARAMVDAGAAVLDIGGESTRPGAAPVGEDEELSRVVPVVEALAGHCEAVISVDTSTPAVMREAAAAGAGMLNDVRALRREGALEAAAATGLPVCLMHMQGEPHTMQDNPQYHDVLAEVRSFLLARVAACEGAGIARRRIVLDPGFGFGKNLAHNLQLLTHLDRLHSLGFPLLVGLSRKSLIAKLTGRAVDERLPGSLALALLAAQRGAALLRVHDVAATADVLNILRAVRDAEEQ
jgi:dihydropteroate synthase